MTMPRIDEKKLSGMRNYRIHWIAHISSQTLILSTGVLADYWVSAQNSLLRLFGIDTWGTPITLGVISHAFLMVILPAAYALVIWRQIGGGVITQECAKYIAGVGLIVSACAWSCYFILGWSWEL